MNSKIYTKLLIAVIVILAIFLVYRNISADNDFKQKLRVIEHQRDSLRSAVDALTERTNKRDEELKKSIAESRKIIEQLDVSIQKGGQDLKKILKEINKSKSKLDSLWN